MALGRFGDGYGDYGQIAVPNARVNVGPVAAAQAGPDAYPSTQWQAATQHVPAGPYVAPVTQYGGPQYGATPTQALAWRARDGWEYVIYSDFTIKILKSMQELQHPAGYFNGKIVNVGRNDHLGIVKQWLNELNFHPAAPPQIDFMNRAATASKQMLEGPSAVSQFTSAMSDLAATLTGGAVGTKTADQLPIVTPASIQAPPPPPPGTQMAIYDPTTLVPPPPPSDMKKYAAVAGGGLLLAGLLGLGWYMMSGTAKTNPDGDE